MYCVPHSACSRSRAIGLRSYRVDAGGHWQRRAANGEGALRKLSSDERIDILITDINMPGMDGYELAESATRMRESAGGTSRPPFRSYKSHS